MKRQAAEVVVISPLELCSMWSLRVTKDLMKVQQRRQGECHILYCEVMKRANTNRLRSSNSLCHRAKPKHLDADSATGSWTCDNQRPVGRPDADTWWSETVFLRYSSVTKRLIRILFSMPGMHAGTTVWCTLIHWHWCLCPTACSQQKRDFEKVLHEKWKRRELSMQLD